MSRASNSSAVGRTHARETIPRGDVDISAVGALLSDPGRCRILLALDDGRALPASRLAAEAVGGRGRAGGRPAEAGVTPATASSHLGKLLDAGLLAVEPYGRNRYYRLAGAQVGQLIEILAQLSPAAPVRSLRQSARADALRDARSCYDHLAGRLGVSLMAFMIAAGHLAGGDGTFDPHQALRDERAGFGHDVDYRLTSSGSAFLVDLGVVLAPRRSVIRYCVDWSEQRHHLAGAIGRGLLDRLVALDWIRRSPGSRAVEITAAGRRGLEDAFGL
jgi:DNA-binding transcriptional ArsR family regulator